MAFIDDLIECFTADPSVNSLVDGIKYQHLDINFDRTKTWVVFNYSSNGGIDTLKIKNAAEKYSLEVQVISAVETTMLTLTDYLNIHFNKYPNKWGFDITLTDTEDNFDPAKSVYFNTLKYDILF